ncbi:MAG: SRPBCC family protein [Bacteroidota bacterium]
MIEVPLQIERAFTLPVAPEAAWDLLADVPRWGRLFPHVETVEPLPEAGPDVWQTAMAPLGPPVAAVRVVYACHYTPDAAARTLTWTPVEGVGNAQFDGRATLRPEAGATAGTLRLGAVLHIPAPRFVRALVGSAVRVEMARMTDTFLDRMRHVWDEA